MDRKIVFSKKSEMQLKEIHDYVFSLSNDLETANSFINNLLDEIEKLKKFTFIGRELILVDNIKTQYRYIRYKNYLIFYRVDDQKIYIDRILSSYKDYVNEFTKEI